MPASNQDLKRRLSRRREIDITVTGRRSGRAISFPIWFVLEGDTLYLLPARGSDTQWYRNVLENASIRIHAGGTEAEFRGVPVAEPAVVKAIVGKFRGKYGNAGVELYTKLDVAVRARLP